MDAKDLIIFLIIGVLGIFLIMQALQPGPVVPLGSYNIGTSGAANSSVSVGTSAATTTDGHKGAKYISYCVKGGGNVWLNFTSTSTGVALGKGILISSSTRPCFEMYPDKFIWYGPIWAIADTTTTVGITVY